MLESLSFKDETKARQNFASLIFVKGCVIVQTCNRVEIYFSLVDCTDAIESLLRLWSREVGVSEDIIRQVTEIYHGKKALLHLLHLASGLESMVVGEDQILGQVRKAIVASKKAGTTSLLLEKVFMKAVNVGRRIRTETEINRGSVSISSTAVELAENSFGGLESTTAFVVGAGEAGTIVAKELNERKVKKLIIANRTYERGYELATKVKGKAVKFEEIYDILPKAHLAFVAVNTYEPVIKTKTLENVLRKRKKRQKLLIIDISQPRAVEETVSTLSDVVLKNIDDLKETIEKNLQKRWKESEKAKQIISEELERLSMQLGRILAQPLLSGIFNKVEDIRQKEFKKALRIMKGIDEKHRNVVEDLTKELMERIMQIPAERLREAAMNNDGTLLSAAEKLFNLEPGKK